MQTAVRIYRIRQRRKHAQWFHRRRQRQFQNQTELMTSSQQARESLGNLTDLFTGMLGTDVAIGGATPDTAPENKLVEEIKKIISAEAASARTADMVNAKISAEKLLADYELGWTTPEDLEQAIINTLNKTLRYDSRARAIDGLPTWDIDRMYTIESLAAEMPIQSGHVTDLIKEIRLYVSVEVAANVDIIMNSLDDDKGLFSGPSAAKSEASIRKSVETASNESMALAATTTAAANTAKMKEASAKVQHTLMVRRNSELHALDQLCQAATDRISELTSFQRRARNTRNQLDHNSTAFADVSEESKYDPIIERERAELTLQRNKRNVMAVEMLGIATRVIRQKTDNKIFKSDDLKKIAELKIWTTDTANMDTTKQLRHLLANWATVNVEEIWSITPFIARLCETGVAGWKIPLIASLTDEKDNVAGSDETKTTYQLLEPHWEALGFACGDPTAEEITAYEAGAGTLTDDADIKEHLKIRKTYEMIRIYIDQSQKAYGELYLFLQDDIKTMCLEEGCYLGDPSEERVNQSTEMDFVTFFEAWFLQCETFGEFARKSARNTLLFATGNFVTDDYKMGCHRVLQAIKEANELDVTATWYETVYTVMSVLKSTRKVIWGLLCPKYQKITGDKDRNFLKDFQQFTIEFMKYMDTGNPVDTKLKVDGQSGRLVAAFTRQTDASYHDIDTRNKKAGSNSKQGGGNGGGNNIDKEKKIDTSQADVSKDVTDSKWSKGKDILHWATTENRLKYYAHIGRGGKRCCDVKGCNTPLEDKRIKSWRNFQIKSDRQSAKAEYHDPTKPWGAYRWAVCAQCLQDAFDNKNNDGGKLIYRDDHTVRIAGKDAGLRAAAAKLATDAAKDVDASTAAKAAKKARKKRNKKQQKDGSDDDGDDNDAKSESDDEESELHAAQAIIKAQQMTIDCQGELLHSRGQSDVDESKPPSSRSSRSSSRSSSSSRTSRRGRGNFTDGAEAIAEHARNTADADSDDSD